MQGSTDLQRIINEAFALPEGEGREYKLRALARMCEFLCEYETDGSATGPGIDRGPLRTHSIKISERILLQGVDPYRRPFRIWDAGECETIEFTDGVTLDNGGEDREIFYDGTNGNLYEVPQSPIKDGERAWNKAFKAQLLADNFMGRIGDGKDDESKGDVSESL